MQEDVSELENRRNYLWKAKKKNLKNQKLSLFKYDSFTFFKLFYVDDIPDKKAEHFERF